jgi:hypothetical protein
MPWPLLKLFLPKRLHNARSSRALGGYNHQSPFQACAFFSDRDWGLFLIWMVLHHCSMSVGEVERKRERIRSPVELYNFHYKYTINKSSTVSVFFMSPKLPTRSVGCASLDM